MLYLDVPKLIHPRSFRGFKTPEVSMIQMIIARYTVLLPSMLSQGIPLEGWGEWLVMSAIFAGIAWAIQKYVTPNQKEFNNYLWRAVAFDALAPAIAITLPTFALYLFVKNKMEKRKKERERAERAARREQRRREGRPPQARRRARHS